MKTSFDIKSINSESAEISLMLNERNEYRMQKNGKIKISTLWITACLLQFHCTIIISSGNQNTNNNNQMDIIQTCAQYKRQLFEVEHFYAVYVPGAPEMRYVEDKCKHYDPFVVGGIPALPKEFPSMTRLGYYKNGSTSWFCGGSLISDRYVLTAAHCFYSLNGEVNRVRLGELDFSRTDDESDPEDFDVKRTIDHPYYNDDSSLYNDIGLVELDRPVTLNSYKHPACLPVNNGDEIPDFIAIGWGSTRFGSAPAQILQKVRLDSFSRDKCELLATRIGPDKLPSGLNINSQLCAGSNQAKDTCHGDSGGPLLVYHEQFPCMYYVVGITSGGIEDCARPGVPGLYTRVHHYMDWIKSYIYS